MEVLLSLATLVLIVTRTWLQMAPLALTTSDVEQVNNEALAALGYSIFGYWLFLDEDDAASLYDAHVRIRVCVSKPRLH
jgi:hypothetical protein